MNSRILMLMKYCVPIMISLSFAVASGCRGCSGDDEKIGFIPRLSLSGTWPMWQHDPSHTGRSPYAGPGNPVSPATIDACCFGLFGSPVLGRNNEVFIGTIRAYDYAGVCEVFEHPEYGASGRLYGIARGGSVMDGFPFDSSRGSAMASAIEDAPVLLSDGSVVFGKDDGWMYRVGPGGELLWESPADDPFDPLDPHDDNEQMIPSPLPGPDNTMVFLSHFADVYGPGPVADAVEAACPALDPSPFKTEATPWFSRLYALDLRDGERRWVFDPATDPASAGQPMVGWGSPARGSDGSCIIGLMNTALAAGHYVPTTSRVFAIGPDGERRWVFPAGGDPPLNYSLWTSAVVSPSGVIYMGASDYTYAGQARVFALTAEGALLWSFSVDENTIAASPALRTDGTLIVATQNRHLSDPAQRFGRVYALADRGDHGEELWRYPAAGTVPQGFFSSPLVDVTGRVYVANEPFPFVEGEQGLLLGINADGSLLFSRTLDGFIHGNLALGSDGALYVPLRKPPRLLVFRDE